MKDLKIFELYPVHDSRRSFYGKALVIDTPNAVYLRSYDTVVCGIEYTDNVPRFVRYWDAWSMTTARHIREFCRQYGVPEFSRREWLAFPVECAPC